MAVFNKDKLNPGAWFDYPRGGRVMVRVVPRSVIDGISEDIIETVVEYKQATKRGPLQRIEFTRMKDGGEREMRERIWDYTIMAWEGFYEDENQAIPLECTRENKALLMGEEPEFYDFVDKCLGILTPDPNEEAKRAEGERKNSSSTANDSPQSPIAGNADE